MIRIALVGLGDIGLNAHLPALLRNPAVSITGLADPIEANRRAGATLAPDAVVAEDMVGVLPHCDAVVLATPPWVTTTLAALALPTHYVLAEKPIGTTVDNVGPLRALPANDLARLQVGLTYRHDPAMEQLHDWVHSGRLGNRLLCRAHIYDEQRNPADPAHTARILGDLEHGPPVMHEGSHVFDWLAYLFGPVREIADAWAIPTGDVVNINGGRLEYAAATALVEFGWWADRLPHCELSVLGDRGYAVLDCLTFRLTLDTAAGRETVEFPGERMARCFDRQLARFVDLIDRRTDRAVPGFEEGLAALRTSEAVKEAARVLE